MLTDPQKVFEKAEEMAARYKQMLLEQAEDGDTIAVESDSIDED
jgi:small subunit ribosomal protein S1